MATQSVSTRVLDALTMAVLLVAVGVAALRWTRTEETAPPVTSNPLTAEQRRDVESSRMSVGQASAPLTVVEFTDYECPACRAAEPRLRQLRAHFGENLRVVYRSWPLEQHRMARRAARVAVCATEIGAFARVHEELMTESEWLEYPDAGLGAIVSRHVSVQDSAAFWACERSETVRNSIDADINMARELGGRGTPFFVINGVRYQQLPDSAELAAVIQGKGRD